VGNLIKISRRIGNKSPTLHKIYTEDEAKKLKMSYVHWKTAKQGEWGITDDGYVAKCFNRKKYVDKCGGMKTFIKLTCGVGWDSPSAAIKFLDNQKNSMYSKINPTKTWDEHECGKTRTKNMVRAYAYMMMGDGGIDYTTLGNIYRPDQLVPGATVKRFLKKRTVQKMVEEKIKELLEKKDVNKEFAVDNILKAIRMAESKGDVNNFLKANDYIMDLLEMKPNKKMITDTIQIDVTKQIADTIAKEDKRLTLQRKSEENDVSE
jgi:hypothetical protein